ncbi:hypothetical protein [Allorhodopirellula heiligendammensis]|uniref:hypothetical protein n=1 Tax=Allorhodopirellula heiligendammensis TaxID=2714739 RepID=UPI00265E04D8|nr:hypothetical protein [Allorhodopirellula heiligendammensis]
MTTAEATAPRTARLMATLGWPNGDVKTVWQVAAACNAGMITDGDADGAAQMARDYANRSTVGLFRTKLAERLKLDGATLSRILNRVTMPGGFPADAPVRRVEPSKNAPAGKLRRADPEPAKMSERATQRAAQNIIRTLAKMELSR